MLTRLIQRTETFAENRTEYEYRDAEYEYYAHRRNLTNKVVQRNGRTSRF